MVLTRQTKKQETGCVECAQLTRENGEPSTCPECSDDQGCPLCGRGPGPYHQQCNAAIAEGVD